MKKTIASVKRLDNSVNGNPRYRIAFDDGTEAVTSSDHSFCYNIGNPGFWVGDTVEVKYGRDGRIDNMKSLTSHYR